MAVLVVIRAMFEEDRQVGRGVQMDAGLAAMHRRGAYDRDSRRNRRIGA
jgi:hypothetical protein